MDAIDITKIITGYIEQFHIDKFENLDEKRAILKIIRGNVNNLTSINLKN